MRPPAQSRLPGIEVSGVLTPFPFSEQPPRDLRTIADLHRLEPLLENRDYSSADIDAVCHGNWLDFLCRWLPQQ